MPEGDTDKLLISLRHLNSVVLVSSDMKKTFWRIGGIPGSALEFKDPKDRFYGQHSEQLTKDGDLILFDNGRNRPEEGGGKYSRVVQYELNWDEGVIRKRWEYRPSRDRYCECCSSVKRLSHGNWWVLFGSARFFGDTMGHSYSELTPDGKEVASYSYYNRDLRATYRSWPVNSIAGEVQI